MSFRVGRKKSSKGGGDGLPPTSPGPSGPSLAPPPSPGSAQEPPVDESTFAIKVISHEGISVIASCPRFASVDAVRLSLARDLQAVAEDLLSGSVVWDAAYGGPAFGHLGESPHVTRPIAEGKLPTLQLERESDLTVTPESSSSGSAKANNRKSSKFFRFRKRGSPRGHRGSSGAGAPVGPAGVPGIMLSTSPPEDEHGSASSLEYLVQNDPSIESDDGNASLSPRSLAVLSAEPRALKNVDDRDWDDDYVERLLETPIVIDMHGASFSVDLTAPTSMWSVAELVNELWAQALTEGYNLDDRANFYLKPTNSTHEDAVSNLGEHTELMDMPYINLCRGQGVVPRYALLPKDPANPTRFDALIGGRAGWNAFSITNPEIIQFRRRMYEIACDVSQSAIRRPSIYSSVSILADGPAPDNLPKKYLVRVHLPGGNAFKTMECDEHQTAGSLLEAVISKVRDKLKSSTLPLPTPDEYMVKICGRAEFVDDNSTALRKIMYIRNCLMKNDRVELQMIERRRAESLLWDKDGLQSAIGQASSTVLDLRNLGNNLALPFTKIHDQFQPPDQDERTQLIELLKQQHRQQHALRRPTMNSGVSPMIGPSPETGVRDALMIEDMRRPFSVRIQGIEAPGQLVAQLADASLMGLYCAFEIWYAGVCLEKGLHTSVVPFGANARWLEWLTLTECNVRDVPAEAVIVLRLFGTAGLLKTPTDACVAVGCCTVSNYSGELLQGRHSVSLVSPDTFDIERQVRTVDQPTSAANPTRPITLFVELPQYVSRVQYKKPEVLLEASRNYSDLRDVPLPEPSDPRDVEMLNRLRDADPLYRLHEEEKKLMWHYRYHVKSSSKWLAKFLMSVDWLNYEARQEAYTLLAIWEPPEPLKSLELLDSRFPDAVVRQYAVERLDELPDRELVMFLLQLAQVLKHERFVDSPLLRFLLRRALRNRLVVGHALFWQIKSEMDNTEFATQYGLLLEAYLSGCGEHRTELEKQTILVQHLRKVAQHIKTVSMHLRVQVMQEMLKEACNEVFVKNGTPQLIQVPLNPSLIVKGIHIDKCKVMDSAKAPLWIVFKNADAYGNPIPIIFKSGDDLRQDKLTLQMFTIMDSIWQKAGLDLRMTPYGCICTGEDEGMIEVVTNSDTAANIQKAAGGATACFKETPVANWLREHNPSELVYSKAADNFTDSCAGYCVGTYVLGIGDRHNDNILITKSGHLVHIDFGHFLGNFKKWAGFKREKAPFVLTPDFAYVMGGREGKRFERFVQLCAKAYNVLRQEAHLFISLFDLMLCTGIPELMYVEDINYLRLAFASSMTDDEAGALFEELILQSLSTKATQLNFAIHILAHSDASHTLRRIR